jgi:hypothetical protein
VHYERRQRAYEPRRQTMTTKMLKEIREQPETSVRSSKRGGGSACRGTGFQRTESPIPSARCAGRLGQRRAVKLSEKGYEHCSNGEFEGVGGAKMRRKALSLVVQGLRRGRLQPFSDSFVRQVLFEVILRVPTALASPSVFSLCGSEVRLEDAVVAGISQSGESRDVLETVRRSIELGASTLLVTNDEDSSLADAAEIHFSLRAGKTMIGSDFPVLVIAPPGRAQPGMRALAENLRDRGAELVVVSDERTMLDKASAKFPVPTSLPEELSPRLCAIPIQVLAEHLARLKGLNPDSPRRLSKVTETW